ncbi:SDR family oxidoreductase [Paraburkholderia elongata]|uniref:SDR family oxidoreductase n=1 Tax=Paraburkholderia elongata TaxID=2675747 RepID=A0A972NQC1_9BURK|nr:SDR family oxidoreductase [Paraburkholderia elongata]NPT57836.1 SDR family oxidoreductase [Paraburkholderia elongata]
MPASKVAIVTGGSRGIGRNAVLCLARQGVHAIFTYKSNRTEADNVIALATDFSGGIVRDNPQVNKAVADHAALGRAGVPEDVGPVIAALLSDDFGWVNAQRIEVSGGMQI